MINQTTKEEYNDEPIQYCENCLSLKIKTIETSNIDYCVECGNTDILEAHIEEWEVLYEETHNKKHINRNEKCNNPKHSH